MASGASLRPVLSNCTRSLQPHLRRKALSQPFSRTFHQSSRIYSAEAAASADDQRPTTTYTYSLPRTKVYEHTRPQPRAPVRHRGPGQEFKVNDDQTVLDEMYGRLLGVGPEGVNLLTPELRWQAVTHRSFDHARQPYNNKLAFLGRRILFFHTNLHILNQTPSPAATTESQTSKAIPESESPTTVSSDSATYLAPSPFEHPHYKNLDAATYEAISEQCNEVVFARIAQRAGLHRVMRWVPAHATDLAQSGVDTVAVECLYAIIGAIALSRGGLEAKKFVNRLLQQRSLLE